MNPKGKISGMLCVRNASERLVEEVMRTYTYPNPAYEAAFKYSPWGKVSADIPRNIEIAKEQGNKLYIPRGFDPVRLLSDKAEKEFEKIQWEDKLNEAPVCFPELLITLNKSQRKLVKAFKRSQRPFGAYLFIAHTSAGKTIAQAYIAALTGQRTLVICHTNLIRNAWYKDLMTAFGIAKKDVGLIQQGKWVIGEHFTLASAATLDRREDRWKELNAEFGCVVVDEVHKMEPRLVRFLKKCPAKFLIGATATDRKEDGENIYLQALFGAPVKRLLAARRDTETSMTLRKVEVTYTKFRYTHDRHNLDLHDLALTLAADEERNNQIVTNSIIDWEEGHSVLIVVKRTAHLRLIHEVLQERGIKDANVLYGATNTKKRYTESLIKAILSRKVRMVVSTIQAIKLGANLNPFDRLHLAWPVNKADLEQLIGRIRRKAEGKTDTVLHYYADRYMPYLFGRFKDKAVPVFRKLRVPGWEDFFIA